MKYLAFLALALAIARATPTKRSDYVQGIDISEAQGTNIDWWYVIKNGVKFVYIKDTEGANYQSPVFNEQYNGAVSAGRAYGAYHVARLDMSSGVDQANYFYFNGDNLYGHTSYDMSADNITSWIGDFVNTYKGYTNRYPVIYTSYEWWNTCTNNYEGFGNDNVPLWLAYYDSTYGQVPHGWSNPTFWQYSDNAKPNPGNADYFVGSEGDLQNFINNS